MKIGLLSDIHGNSLALAAVLKSAMEKGAEVLCIAGDFVGYYYNPDKVLNLLDPWTFHSVQGNHERMLKAALRDNEVLGQISLRYGTGIKEALKRLKTQQINDLCSLPETLMIELGGRRVFMAHGSPWDGDFYLYPNAEKELLQRACVMEPDVVVLGHTHYPMMQRIGKSLLVNPGSVGQPRDRRPGASWALLDTETMRCRHFLEHYNIAAVIDEARLRDPMIPYLAEVLARL